MRQQDRSWTPAERPPDELAAGPVVLKRWRTEAAEALALELEQSREHLAPWLAWAAVPQDRLSFLLGSEAAFETRTDFGYGIWEPGGRLAGGAGLHARLGPGALEIGYWIAVGSINRGYATAAARALTDAAFTLAGVERVEIHCDERNVRSAAVPRKLGYRLARIEPDSVDAPAESGRSMVWVMTPPAR